ncbi:unannotated protein [freshwater metagenome]|uniref:Unannotated protein n=1 Tax=freshwater metagenome TaxID=449393 RepID=A0A6J7C1Y7_9ZZZZ
MARLIVASTHTRIPRAGPTGGRGGRGAWASGGSSEVATAGCGADCLPGFVAFSAFAAFAAFVGLVAVAARRRSRRPPTGTGDNAPDESTVSGVTTSVIVIYAPREWWRSRLVPRKVREPAELAVPVRSGRR